MVRAAQDVETKTREAEIKVIVRSVTQKVQQMAGPHDHRTIVRAMKQTIPDGSVTHDMWVEIYEDSLEALLQAVTARVGGKPSDPQLTLLPATSRFTTVLAATPRGRPMIVGNNGRSGRIDRRLMQTPVHDR